MQNKRLTVADVVALATEHGRPMSPQRVRELARRHRTSSGRAGGLKGRVEIQRSQEVWTFSRVDVEKFLELDRPVGRPKSEPAPA